MRYDWNGRLAETSDSFGKHQTFSYNDADEQTRIDDLALGKSVAYEHDALGRRTAETLTKGGLVQRQQTHTYNSQGWLTGVNADAGFDAGGGAELGQQLNVSYKFDAAGNRAQVNSNGVVGQYRYDAEGRMTQAVDDQGTGTDTVHQVQYDGFGNRILESRTLADGNAQQTGYTYDAANRVVASTADEAWSYDANGNTVSQRNRDGSRSSSQYNAENRATVTDSAAADGKATQSTNSYDAVGNVTSTRITGDKYGFTERTVRDVRYLETGKTITDSYAKGAKRLEGTTSFQYDANGNLTLLDRGRRQSGGGNNVAFFDYDLEGHIIGRADKPSALSNANYFRGSQTDPGTTVVFDDYGVGLSFSQRLRLLQNGGGGTSSTRLQNYIYANNKPIAEASGDLQIALKTIALQGGEPVYDAAGEQLGYELALQGTDLKYQADGTTLDRAATARAIAERAYTGWSELSASAQAKVVAYVLEQLPASVQAASGQPATKVLLHGWITLADSQLNNQAQITDYSYRQIGASTPGGTVQNHTVRSGDTLQSIAQIYFGSPSYWYLIADANGLSGNEALDVGTTLKIPNQVANSANTADTFKVYNESEIIGSTSPEIRTIKKKKKWYQKLIQIVIVVIAIAAAVITAGAALGALGVITPAIGGLLGVGAQIGLGLAGTLGISAGVVGTAAVGLTAGTFAVSAIAGAGIYAAANVLSQGLAIAADLQNSFSWKAVGKAAVTGAVTGAATAVTAGYIEALKLGSAGNVAARVGVEAGKQLAIDGKISNIGGLIGAAASGGAFGKAVAGYGRSLGAGLSILESVAEGKGDNAMQWVSLATSALFDSKTVSPELFTGGNLNWAYVAVQATGAAIVGSRMGEDAGLSYFGGAIGQGLAENEYSNLRRYQQEQARQQVQPSTAGGVGAQERDPARRVSQRSQEAIDALDEASKKYGGYDRIPANAPEMKQALAAASQNSGDIGAVAEKNPSLLAGADQLQLAANSGDLALSIIGDAAHRTARNLAVTAGFVGGMAKQVMEDGVGAAMLVKDVLLAQQYVFGGSDSYLNREVLPFYEEKKQAYENVKALGESLVEVAKDPRRYIGDMVGNTVDRVAGAYDKANQTESLKDWFSFGLELGGVAVAVVGLVAGGIGAARLATSGARQLNAIVRTRLDAPSPNASFSNVDDMLGSSRRTVILQTRTASEVNQAMIDAGNMAAWGGRTVTTEMVSAGTRFNMVVSEGQAQALMAGKPAFGGWATSDSVPGQVFARNKLGILPEFKPDVSFVVQVETTASQTLNRGIVGPIRDYAGGANQVEFLGTRNLRVVGQPQPLPLGR